MTIRKIAKGTTPLLLAAALAPAALIPASSPAQPHEQGRHLTFLEQRFAYLESFSHLEAMQRGGNSLFAQRIETRLPRYQGLMQRAAQQNHLDWTLLAAMSYQESHWDADATSPTGVRGLMMLTKETARELAVTDRLNPRQSVLGGARYFASLRDRLPTTVAEPDRTWMALAAYNMGMSHLEDARILTQHLGKNPDRWTDVKQHIPLLQDPAYYPYLPNGYARGKEAIAYVERIRQYHTILSWHHTIEAEGLAAVRDQDRFADVLALHPRESAPRAPTAL